MAISPDLLQASCRELARFPVDPGDLPVVAAQLGSQLDGLAALDAVDLTDVEPATELRLGEAPHA